MSVFRENHSKGSIYHQLNDQQLIKRESISSYDNLQKRNAKYYDYDESDMKKDKKRIIKVSSQIESAHDAFIERLIAEASSNKQRQQSKRSVSDLNSENFEVAGKSIEIESDDDFLEKIVEKFEDIRFKRTNVYPGSSSSESDDDCAYGSERIIERRFYVKKPKLPHRSNKLTSTSDLSQFGKKRRQISGDSTITNASITCSQCSSSTPTFVETLRHQSETLRDELLELKNEVEHLHTTQRKLFQHLNENFQTNTTLPKTVQTFAKPNISPVQTPSEQIERISAFRNLENTKNTIRSVSVESLASSSVKSDHKSTSTVESRKKQPATPPNIPTQTTTRISEFTATKNPLIPQAPSIYSNNVSKSSAIIPIAGANSRNSPRSPSTTSTSSISEFFGAKVSTANNLNTATVPPISQHTANINSKPPSVVRTIVSNSSIHSTSPQATSNTVAVTSQPPLAPPMPRDNFGVAINSSAATLNSQLSNSKTHPDIQISSVKSNNTSRASSQITIPVTNTLSSSKPPPAPPMPPDNFGVPSIPAVVTGKPPINARNQIIESRQSITTPIESVVSSTSSASEAPLTLPSARIPLYENEIAHRRTLSPETQKVAASISIQESSDSSSESTSRESTPVDTKPAAKNPVTELRQNDLRNLSYYSSQLELAGFTPSVKPVFSNPNASETFWQSVDEFIASSRSSTMIAQQSAPSKPTFQNSFGQYNQSTKRLDKYNLEIKPQENIASTAPLIMPPLDTFSYHDKF